MTFNSITFIFWFLPVFFILYYISPRQIKPWTLLAFSYLFYAWGSVVDLVVLLAVTLLNWGFGHYISGRKYVFAAAIIADVSILAAFKYFEMPIASPLGISFFIFHAISYLSDVYHSRSDAAKNPAELALYLALFTKLTMGPIVSYSSLAPQLKNLNVSLEKIEAGIVRFCVGLAKKAVLAGSLAEICENCWADAGNSTLSAWIGILGFTLQLYFDFSGYSDMAIGLSNMLGIDIAENFRYPYLSYSVSDFWRRWHISLGAWFREYMYIPLGGSRVKLPRLMLNLLIVWAATGIWHGTGFNFIVWGLLHGFFVCIEKILVRWIHFPKLRLFGWIYTLAVVIIGWVLFNSADLPSAIEYIRAMFGNAVNLDNSLAMLMLHDNKVIIAAAIIFATPIPAQIGRRLFDGLPPAVVSAARLLLIAFCLYISITYMMVSGYTPFIYTEF